jgi:hypothetical protein
VVLLLIDSYLKGGSETMRKFETSTHNGFIFRTSGSSESWTTFTIFKKGDLEYFDGYTDLNDPKEVKRIYREACQKADMYAYGDNPGSPFAHSPSMLISRSRVLLIQTGGLDI